MRPTIFSIVASWDEEAAVWVGHCDEVPAAADAPTLDGLFEKIQAITMDLLPDNHPGLDPECVFLQLTALKSAVPEAA